MSSAGFPDDSREDGQIFTDEEAAELLFLAAMKAAKNLDLSLGLPNRDGENLEERRSSDSHGESSPDGWRRKWIITDEERARRQKEQYYEAARDYALDLHSDQSLKIVQRQEKNEEKEVKGEEKSQFKKAKEAIEKRRQDTSTTLPRRMEVDLMIRRKEAPTLMELSARVLAKYSESIESLRLVPEHLRKKVSNHVGDLGKINTRFMQLLIEDSPCEICARNCVNIEEEDLIKILYDCDRVSLRVLILDLCGRAMTDYAITEFLKRSPNGFPSLTKLSLHGAFSLTDNALALILRSSPLLQFINLSDCSLLTSHAVKILADTFGSTLKGLNIGGCQGIDRSKGFSSSLTKFKKLNYLSVAGLERINDGAVQSFLMFCSSNLTDLSLASCNKVTDDCIWHIGRYCKKLEALDISDLDNLTDISLEFITEGCKSLNSVKLTKTRFSDEGIAAFLEVLGGSLNQLCLNKVRDVGQNTAISLAKFCKRLHYLDLSWCRRLAGEELRGILSGCSSLRSLKVFGWTQVEDEYLGELSRSHVHITGLKMTSLYAHRYDSYPSMNAKFF